MINDKKTIADSSARGENKPVVVRCTLAEMIENDYLDISIGSPTTTDGFTIGKKGKAKFYMYDPTPNGYYKIYQQNERGDIVGIRYVDANKTMVTVWGV